MNSEEFHGCKVALIREDRMLVFLRDDIQGIESPNMWDLPGGGREGTETPEECVLRELNEEFGLLFEEDRLTYKRRYHKEYLGRSAYFFVGRISQEEIDAISFGDEGRYWKLMLVNEYLSNSQAVLRHQVRVRDYLATMDA